MIIAGDCDNMSSQKYAIIVGKVILLERRGDYINY